MVTVQLSKSATSSVSASQSLSLVKNLMRVGLSQICYIRNIFPDDCFRPRYYCDTTIMHMEPYQKNDADPNGPAVLKHKEANLLTLWLEKGVFVALEKRYLRTLLFAITAPDEKTGEDRVIETYRWKVTYPDNDSVLLNDEKTATNKEELKAQATHLIRNLMVFSETLGTLPSERYLTMKLMYYEDRTPEDWEPEFFDKTAGDALTIDDSNSLRVKIGGVSSPHYKVDLKYMGVDLAQPPSQPTSNGEPQRPPVMIERKTIAKQKATTTTAAAPTAAGTATTPTPAPTPQQDDDETMMDDEDAAAAQNLSDLTLTALSLDDRKTQKKKTAQQAATAAEKAKRGAAAAALETAIPPTIVSASIGFAELKKVRSYMYQYGGGAAISITNKFIERTGLSEEKIRIGLKKLKEEGVVEEKSWGSRATRYALLKKMTSGGSSSQKALGGGGKQYVTAAGGGNGDEGDDDEAREEGDGGDAEGEGAERTPAEAMQQSSEKDEAEVDDDKTEIEDDDVPAASPVRRGMKRQARTTEGDKEGSKTLGREYLLEQGSGFALSLTQDDPKAAKASQIIRPIIQSNKRARK